MYTAYNNSNLNCHGLPIEFHRVCVCMNCVFARVDSYNIHSYISVFSWNYYVFVRIFISIFRRSKRDV